jgi:valyl-tRNA synthetase
LPPVKEAALFIVGQIPFVLPLGGSIDITAEAKRLSQDLAKLTAEMESCQKRLSNTDFMSKAKPEIIEEIQERLKDFGMRKNKVEEALARLRG